MPIQPVKIPQNVYIEDRIIGPITLKQIIIVCMGCGLSYALWASVGKASGGIGIPLTVILWIPGALSVLFAFVRVNDLSLIRICFLLLEKMSKPSTRTWEPRPGISINIRTFTAPKPDTAPHPAAADHPKQLEDLSSDLDLPPPPLPVRPERITVSDGATDTPFVDTLQLDEASTTGNVQPTISLMRDIS